MKVSELRKLLRKKRKKVKARASALGKYKYGRSTPVYKYQQSKKQNISYMRKSELYTELQIVTEWLDKYKLKTLQTNRKRVKGLLKKTLNPYDSPEGFKVNNEVLSEFMDYYEENWNEETSKWYEFIDQYYMDNYYNDENIFF